MSPILKTDRLYIEIEPSEIPWLKIFTKIPYKEMSEAPQSIKEEIYALLDLIEKAMIEYYTPEKINIASFGNYMPHLHWHIMARFKNDSYFPEPMWGKKQRESTLTLPDMEGFVVLLKKRLEKQENLLERYSRLLYTKAQEISKERKLPPLEALKEALLFIEGEMSGY